MAEGRLEAQRADVLQALDARFGSEAAAEFKEQVERLDDSEHLSALHRFAITCRSLAQFRREFGSVAAVES